MRQNVLRWKKFRSLLLLLVVLVAGVFSARGDEQEQQQQLQAPWRIHTLFSVECQNYFDWQTVGLVHSFKKARQPGPSPGSSAAPTTSGGITEACTSLPPWRSLP